MDKILEAAISGFKQRNCMPVTHRIVAIAGMVDGGPFDPEYTAEIAGCAAGVSNSSQREFPLKPFRKTVAEVREDGVVYRLTQQDNSLRFVVEKEGAYVPESM